jgi:alkylation response protein AidB-like acyl-CoA dehydrogenase
MTATQLDLISILDDLGPTFAARAAEHDAEDSFVSSNFEALKTRGVLAAGVPTSLGGGGATHRELCDFLRELAHYCPSTALALSMHMHQVMIPEWRWRNENGAGEPLLRRVAAENLHLVSTGGSDWLESSGSLEKVEGGYRFTARKVFSSGSPSGDLLITSGILEDPTDGPTVLHFPVSLRAEGVTVQDNWRTMGMRATGSNDVLIDGVFVPDAAIGGRRPKGTWGIFHLVAMLALPLIYSVYVGVAEKARALALERAAARRDDLDVRMSVGEMENSLRGAQIALESVIALAEQSKPGPNTTNEALIRRTLIANNVLAVVDQAMSVAGGAGFFRSFGLERLFRDAQGARYHPLTENRQLDFTARFTLGMPIE